MRPETEPLRRARRVPDLEAEQEVDFGSLFGRVAARWWLVLAAALVGALVGYLLSFGGGSTYRATATLYLGQPASPVGAGNVQSLATNPTSVNQIVRSEAIVRSVAAEIGVPPARLRRGISTSAVAGANARIGQNPLVNVSVRGPWREDTARAANLLATAAGEQISGYVNGKIEALEENAAAQERELAAVDAEIEELRAALDGGGLSSAERLSVVGLLGLAEQRRGQVVASRTTTRELLSYAENVEQSRIVGEAAPVRIDARSGRSSIAVGAFAGLVAGIALALLWDPVVRRRRLQRA